MATIPDAFEINRAYANNTPSMMVGGYAEVGYNLYMLIDAESRKNLTVFARQELMNLNYKIPSNGIKNGTNRRSYTVAGITYQPVSGVIVNLDYVLRHTDERNEDLIVTPFPQQLPYLHVEWFPEYWTRIQLLTNMQTRRDFLKTVARHAQVPPVVGLLVTQLSACASLPVYKSNLSAAT